MTKGDELPQIWDIFIGNMEFNYKIDVVMLERMHISAVDIGIYSLGVTIAQKVWIIPDALRDILTSNLAKGKEADEVCKITRLSLFVSAACIVVLIIFGQPIVTILFGAEYSGAYSIVVWIAAGTLGMVFYKMIYAYNVVNGRKNINLILLGIAALANIAANFILIPIMGTIGAALASSISYSLCGICFIIAFCRITGARPVDLLLVKKDDFRRLKAFMRK